ncbi:hypothetical protein BH11PSE2_BH11PSE2_14550 [soil metagenome]
MTDSPEPKPDSEAAWKSRLAGRLMVGLMAALFARYLAASFMVKSGVQPSQAPPAPPAGNP